ncbi:MAG: CapA family protein [Clostridium sp.]|nr:CapA family protein [Clostridium sp.]
MKKKKYRKKRSNFILPFLITLASALAIGLFCIFSYLWYHSETGYENENASVQEVISVIPEKDVVAEDDGQKEEAVPPGKYDSILQDKEYMEANNIYAKEAADKESVTITFAGDMLFDPNYAMMATLIKNGGDIKSGIAPELIAEMKSADIMMINNEFAYSNRGEPLDEKQFTFRAKPEYVSYLYDLGVDIVSLANNHTYDYGEQALLDTLQTLKDAGMPYVGAGTNLEEAAAPVYFIINDIKIAFISATQIERLDNPDTKGATEISPGVFRCWNAEKLLQVIAAAKAESDFVVVYVHWGTENQEETDWAQNKQAPEMVEAGADLIIGDHPHILQKIDMIDGVPVIYSLGNFWFNSKTLDTGMVKIVLTKDGLQSYQFIPCLQSGCKTTLLSGEEKERVLGEMRRMSPDVLIDAEGYVIFP